MALASSPHRKLHATGHSSRDPSNNTLASPSSKMATHPHLNEGFSGPQVASSKVPSRAKVVARATRPAGAEAAKDQVLASEASSSASSSSALPTSHTTCTGTASSSSSQAKAIGISSGNLSATRAPAWSDLFDAHSVAVLSGGPCCKGGRKPVHPVEAHLASEGERIYDLLRRNLPQPFLERLSLQICPFDAEINWTPDRNAV
ncbi:hypothetical protein IAT38_001314 [Cryptococcus sp. DSM 104549]